LKNDLSEINKCGFDDVLFKPIKISSLYNKLVKQIKYTIKEAAIEVNSDSSENFEIETISDETKVKLPDLIKQFENDFIPRWKLIIQNHFIHDIIDFAKEIINMGIEYKLQLIERYGNELILYSESFDIENLDKTILEFPNIIGKLKKMTL